MRLRIRILAIALAIMATTGSSVVAQTVLSNGAPSGQAGFDIFNDYRSADDFTVSGSLGFDLIRFWGLLPAGSTYAPTIFWQILADAGGAPGATVAAGGAATVQSTLRTSVGFGFDSWQFDLAVGPQLLGPGIFWLALHDGALGDATDSTLLWEMSNAQSASQFAVDFVPTGEWTGNWGGDLAFELRTTENVTATPEPATVSLLAIGVISLVIGRRWRRTP